MRRTLADFTEAPEKAPPRYLSFYLCALLIFPAEPLTLEEIGQLSGLADPARPNRVVAAATRLKGRNLVKRVAKGTYQITPLGLKVQGELQQQLDWFPDGYEGQD